MTAERLAKNFERMVITSERLKKNSNGRPERLPQPFERIDNFSERMAQAIRTDG